MTSLTDYTSPATALQAVNVMLGAAGEKPVGSLDVPPGSMADQALKWLGETSREVQTEGWSFNSDEAFPIDPGTDGSITLPGTTLRVSQIYYQATEPSAGAPAQMPGQRKIGMRLARRGQRLYDYLGHTFNIGRTVYVDIVTALNFEDLPQAARWYITCKAARRLVAGKLISGTAYQFTQADEADARIRLEQEENEATQLDGLAGNPHLLFMRRK